MTDLRDRLALWTSGMSGADIAKLCNEAALTTARKEDIEDGVQIADFDSALERIIAGKIAFFFNFDNICGIVSLV